MRRGMKAEPAGSRVGTATWIGLAAGASAAFSLALACAAPFAALAALGAARLPRREALSLVGVAWLVNQAVGYGLLGYPRNADSVGWGLAIGVAALAATLAAERAARIVAHPLGQLGLGFAAAFCADQLLLLAATAFLPSGPEAFATPVVLWLLGINALALAGLLALRALATAVGLVAPSQVLGVARA